MRATKLGLLSLMVGVLIAGVGLSISAHERKQVAGLEVVFGAEPEPALNGQLQFLRWRFSGADK